MIGARADRSRTLGKEVGTVEWSHGASDPKNGRAWKSVVRAMESAGDGRPDQGVRGPSAKRREKRTTIHSLQVNGANRFDSTDSEDHETEAWHDR